MQGYEKKSVPPLIVILFIMSIGSCAGSVYVMGTIESLGKYGKEYIESVRASKLAGIKPPPYKEYDIYEKEKERGSVILFFIGCAFLVALFVYIKFSKAGREYADLQYILDALKSQPKYKEEAVSRYITLRVRREVWRRDEGTCTECGSRENIEFDHIIPVSKGGSSKARNVELLCQSCNRSKHNKIE